MTLQLSAGATYAALIAAAKGGDLVDTRLGPAREIRALSVCFPAGLLVRRRHVNYRLGWQELLQLLAGVYAPNMLARVAPKANMSLFTPQMAYGPRVSDQIPMAVCALHRDPASRQVVLTFGSPSELGTTELPCTVAYQFLLRGETLHAVVTMRSWDLFRGLPYDIVMFGGLLRAVALTLGARPGSVTVTAGSAHVYESDAYEADSGLQYFRFTGILDELTLQIAAKLSRATMCDRWFALKMWAFASVYGDWTIAPRDAPPNIVVEKEKDGSQT